ncbi:MAG: outer membrane beta-barrel protein [Prevotella sp.]|nr:outer membrane beta-barrel protein [Prevotella sp.]
MVLMASITCHLPLVTSSAQDDTEYRMEIGGGLGLQTYQGDFSGSIISGMQPMAAIVAKYKSNPRMAWSAQLGFGQLKGSSKDVKTWFPALNANPVDFKTSLTSFSLRYEYNFWPFGTGQEYLGAKPLTPFMAAGIGLAFASPKLSGTMPAAENGTPIEAPSSVAAGTLNFAFGVKYKVAPRLNLTAEWAMSFTGTDKIDGIKDPYGIASSGMFKNNDSFSTLQLSLTYDIWAKCKTCHNDFE